MRFSVSILAFNQLAHTQRCVASVLAHSPAETELLLTDNGSTDGTAEYFAALARDHPARVRLRINAENLGFIAPNRAALAAARGEFFAMLNNDCEVSPGWLEKLAAPFGQFPRAALSGPKSGCSALRDDLRGYRVPAPEDRAATAPARGVPPMRPKWVPRNVLPAGDAAQGGFEYIEGSCVLGRASILREVGLFSPDLEFAYGEDADLCLRLRHLGYTLHLVDVAIAHAGGSTRKTSPELDAKLRECEQRNHEHVRRRFGHYLKVRRTDYPIFVLRKHARGDVLLTTPVVRALATRFATCPIHVRTLFPEFFARHPLVASAGPDLVPPRNALVIDLETAYEDRPRTNIIDAYADAAGLLREEVPHRLEMYPAEEAHAWARRQLASVDADELSGGPARRWCAIHPGPTLWPGKNWSMARWAAVAEQLRAEGWSVVLVGSDRPLSHSADVPREVRGGSTANDDAGAIPCALDLRGRGVTTMHQLAAVLARCGLFVGVDSCPMHVAQSMGVPTVGLFGCTTASLIMTDSSPHVGVEADRTHPEAGIRHTWQGVRKITTAGAVMELITVEQVLAGIAQVMHGSCKPATA